MKVRRARITASIRCMLFDGTDECAEAIEKQMGAEIVKKGADWQLWDAGYGGWVDMKPTDWVLDDQGGGCSVVSADNFAKHYELIEKAS